MQMMEIQAAHDSFFIKDEYVLFNLF
ncbi:conserved protein of unknown function [Pseudomonas marincola]|uniref:Uncharacterized protein n=1 Tax=Pseudomonas marincola TaxID=437900 RepID=A0A653E5I9_9PSED|nr:conserved protein of unknown function [Pseudomonas marincola]